MEEKREKIKEVRIKSLENILIELRKKAAKSELVKRKTIEKVGKRKREAAELN